MLQRAQHPGFRTVRITVCHSEPIAESAGIRKKSAARSFQLTMRPCWFTTKAGTPTRASDSNALLIFSPLRATNQPSLIKVNHRGRFFAQPSRMLPWHFCRASFCLHVMDMPEVRGRGRHDLPLEPDRNELASFRVRGLFCNRTSRSLWFAYTDNSWVGAGRGSCECCICLPRVVIAVLSPDLPVINAMIRSVN